MILSENRSPLFGIMPVSARSTPFQAPGQNALLRVQAVLRLIENHRLRPVDDLVCDFIAPMRGRQCMKIASGLARAIKRAFTWYGLRRL